MATHPRDNEDDWVRDWSGTGHFFTAIKYRVEQNKLEIQKSHAESQATQRMRQQRGREYQQMLQEMQTMTDPRRVAAPKLVPTTATSPRQHTDALDISMMPTMLMSAVRAPQRVATTDEIPMQTRRTNPLPDLVNFYQDNGKWHYVDKLASATDLIEKAIDAYGEYHHSIPVQELHISSICLLLLVLAHKITSLDGKNGMYEDERGSFLVKGDACIDVDTVRFENKEQ